MEASEGGVDSGTAVFGSIRYAQKTALVLNFMVIRVSKDMVSRSKYWISEKNKGEEYSKTPKKSGSLIGWLHYFEGK